MVRKRTDSALFGERDCRFVQTFSHLSRVEGAKHFGDDAIEFAAVRDTLMVASETWIGRRLRVTPSLQVNGP